MPAGDFLSSGGVMADTGPWDLKWDGGAPEPKAPAARQDEGAERSPWEMDWEAGEISLPPEGGFVASAKQSIGSAIKGVVRNLTEYGAFVQIEDGIDALLHVSDLSWTKKITNPGEVLQKGQEVEVQVLSIDPEAEKISVGLKQLQSDPWLSVVEKLPIGAHVEVEIVKLVAFGAFGRLDNSVEGLIHVSELSQERVNKPEDVLKVGDTVWAKVISINAAERRIGLSMREYQRDQERLEAGEEIPAGESVDVSAALGGSLPQGIYQAGRSLADVAHDLYAAVSRSQNAAAQEQAEAQAASAEDAPAEEPPLSGVPEATVEEAAPEPEQEG